MSDLGCPPNAPIVFDFLIGKGLSHEQAAGVIGNLRVESGLNPQLEAMDTNNKMSRGIAMWQPPRWQNLLTFAAGRDPWTLDTQLEFLWYELQTDPSLGLAQLLASTTVDDATVVFQNRFEKPRADLAHTDKRIEFASAAFLTCPLVRPPPDEPKAGIVAVTVGALALVVAAGYGVYKAFAARPEPEPAPPWPRPRPIPLPSPPPMYFPRRRI